MLLHKCIQERNKLHLYRLILAFSGTFFADRCLSHAFGQLL